VATGGETAGTYLDAGASNAGAALAALRRLGRGARDEAVGKRDEQ
jgi:hypothetical protein